MGDFDRNDDSWATATASRPLGNLDRHDDREHAAAPAPVTTASRPTNGNRATHLAPRDESSLSGGVYWNR